MGRASISLCSASVPLGKIQLVLSKKGGFGSSKKRKPRLGLSPFHLNPYLTTTSHCKMAPKSILKKRPAPTEEPTASSAPSPKVVKSKGSIKLAVAAPAPAEESGEDEEDESSEDESMDASEEDEDSEEEDESDDEETIRALAEGQPRPAKSEFNSFCSTAWGA